MLGHFVRIEKPMTEGDDITDLCVCRSGSGNQADGNNGNGHRVVLFNNKYFRLDSLFLISVPKFNNATF